MKETLTVIAMNMVLIGRLAAIAVIRTFVNFFLERDLAEVEKREAASSRMRVVDGAP
jgi:uncharacterized membrane protein